MSELPFAPALRALYMGSMVALGACGAGRVPEPEQPVGETHTTSSSTGGARAQGTDQPEAPVYVLLGPEVRHACELPTPKGAPPLFDIDRDGMRPRDEDVLQRVAACIVSGALGDATVIVTGHTDPRGSGDYNDKLGLYRARSAKQHLVDFGVPPGRVMTQSRGARDARGTDEATWPHDHRVDVHLQGPSAGPADEAPSPDDPAARPSSE